MTDDEQDAQDWARIKRFFDLKTAFNSASQSAANSISTPGKAAAVTAVAGIGGVALGSVAVKAAIVTGVLAVGAFLSFFTFNPIAILALGGLTVAGGAVTGLAAKGAAWLLGAAKGAFLDAKYDRTPAAEKPATAPAVDNAPSTGLTVKPVANEFNNSADPATGTKTDIKPVQPEQPRAPGGPTP
jgi:hypothetical protein